LLAEAAANTGKNRNRKHDVRRNVNKRIRCEEQGNNNGITTDNKGMGNRVVVGESRPRRVGRVLVPQPGTPLCIRRGAAL